MCVDSPSTHASILFNSENFGRFKTVSVDGFLVLSLVFVYSEMVLSQSRVKRY